MRRCLELNHRQGTWFHICNFDVELEVLYGRMACEVTCVLYPFISFACVFKAEKVHNMLALILGPCFKRLECVIELAGVVSELVEEYNNHVFCLSW